MKTFQRFAVFTIFLAVLSGCEKVWDTSGYDPLPGTETPDDSDEQGDPSEPSDPSVTPPSTDPSISAAYQITGGTITRTVLNNYLSRAITESEYLCTRTHGTELFYGQPDDKRMLLNIGAKFIGRAIYYWGQEKKFGSEGWMSGAKTKVQEYHQQDPEAIFQAAVFEIVTKDVNQVKIPEWVFTAFGKTPEDRNFNFDLIRDEGGRHNNYWGTDTCVPDISREETQMWFYYQIVRYMEVGCEAVHLGQVMLIASLGDSGNGYAGYKRLIDLVRKAAKTKARRGVVLLDAHMSNGGLIIGGKQYLDFISFPLRLKEKTNEQATLGAAFEVNGSYYSDNIIGRTGNMPYLLEFDNYGKSGNEGNATSDHFVWGYDEITWFAKLDYTNGCVFLDYATKFLADKDPNKGHLQMPGMRLIQFAPGVFRCNNKSSGYNDRFGYESKIKQLWSK